MTVSLGRVEPTILARYLPAQRRGSRVMPDILGSHDQHRRLPSRRKRPEDPLKAKVDAGVQSGTAVDSVRTGTSSDAIAEALLENQPRSVVLLALALHASPAV